MMYLRTTRRITPGRACGELPSDAALAPALAAIHGFYLFAADAGLVGGETVIARFTILPAPVATHPRRVTVVRPQIRVDARDEHSFADCHAAIRPGERAARETTSSRLRLDGDADDCMTSHAAVQFDVAGDRAR